MLAGDAVVAIWNGITPEGRAEFYAWHLHEHMGERVDIPGFRRGRRYIAIDDATHPEFFTLYEADDFGVLQGPDYLARLNAPSDWTRTATQGFRDTSRALARVTRSHGPGMGGVLLAVRFDVDADTRLLPLLAEAEAAQRVTGVHLCRADDAASGVKTAESRDRTDIQAPPAWFALIEATDAEALDPLLRTESLQALGVTRVLRGLYRLEHVRTKAGSTGDITKGELS